jgi:hypothetical protein
MTPSRRTAAIVGLLFLLATATFIAADTLIKGVLGRSNYLIGASGDANPLAAGALLAFVDGLAVVGIAVLVFPFLRHTSESLALAYVGLRVAELGVVLLYMAVPLMVLALGNGARAGTVDASASQSLGSLLTALRDVALVLLYLFTGASGIIFAVLLYRSKLVPRPFAVLGLIGYPVLLAGAALTMFGVTDVQQGTGMLAMLPGGLFELILPIWLLAKGFSHPVVTGVASSDPTDRASVAARGQATVTT